MTNGEHIIGVAVIAGDDVAAAVRECHLFDALPGAPGITHRIVVVKAQAEKTAAQLPGWRVVQGDDGRKIAMAHSQACRHLAVHHCGEMWRSDQVLVWMEMADRGQEDSGFARVCRDTKPPASPPPDMIGATIITRDYAEIGAEAARRFREHTGLPVLRIEVDDGEGFDAKLALPDLCPARRVVFFDADLWMLRPADLAPWAQSAFAAVPDPQAFSPRSFCREDALTIGINAALYFNSGFFIADLGDSGVREAFASASIARKTGGPMKDITDQSWLNAAVRKGATPVMMPPEWNFYPLSWVWGCVREMPRAVIGLHAAGVPGAGAKMDHLRQWAAVLSTPMDPILDTVP